MNSTDFLLRALQALQTLPTILEAGGAAMELISQTTDRFHVMQQQGRGPSPEEKAAQDELIERMRHELHAPDTPEEAGAPETPETPDAPDTGAAQG